MIVGDLVALAVTAATLWLSAWAAAALDGLARGLATGAPLPPGLLVRPVASLGRLLGKEDLVPARADGGLFRSAPAAAVAVVLLAAAVVPVGRGTVVADPGVGLFFFIVLLAPFAIALMNAGWGANSKYGVVGAFRAGAHVLAYEVPFGFAAIGAPMAAESLSFVRVVEAQEKLWYGVWQPLGLAIYLAAAAIITYRPPFDLPHAPDLAGGVLADQSGSRYALLRGAMLALWVVVAAAGAALFLGGWQGPLLPGPVWMVLKTGVLLFVMSWVGYRFPRQRVDQMLAFSWKVLLPASLVNIALVGVLILLQEGGM